jgi:hypothetical protein
MRTITAAAGLSLVAASTAFAHPGDHSRMSPLEFIQHYAEPDHLAFLALTVIVGVLAFRWGRRVEAKVRSGADKQGRNRL